MTGVSTNEASEASRSVEKKRKFDVYVIARELRTTTLHGAKAIKVRRQKDIRTEMQQNDSSINSRRWSISVTITSTMCAARLARTKRETKRRRKRGSLGSSLLNAKKRVREQAKMIETGVFSAFDKNFFRVRFELC